MFGSIFLSVSMESKFVATIKTIVCNKQPNTGILPEIIFQNKYAD